MVIEPYFQAGGITLYLGDNREVLPTLDVAVSAVVTDPPAGISFMGKDWDHHKGGRDQWIAWLASVLAECERVMLPGAHALVWALPRTSGWTHRAIEDAGLDVRDSVLHLFGSGFPKSLDVGKALDATILRGGSNTRRLKQTNEHDREELGERYEPDRNNGFKREYDELKRVPITAPATPEAQQWDGWGTALKPSAEYWYLARKPLTSTVAAQVLATGTGAINVDGTRVAGKWTTWKRKDGTINPSAGFADEYVNGSTRPEDVRNPEHPAGRWPPNTLLDTSAAAMLDQMSGERDRRGAKPPNRPDGFQRFNGQDYNNGKPYQTKAYTSTEYADGGGASKYFPVLPVDDPDTLRFLYCPKASRAERNAGLDGMPERASGALNVTVHGDTRVGRVRSDGAIQHASQPIQANHHPTVKPLALMRWLLTLVTPPNGAVILDPFAGSGSTLVAAAQLGISAIGVEMDEEYAEIAARRIEHALAERAATVRQIELVAD